MSSSRSPRTLRYVYTQLRVERYILDDRGEIVDHALMKRGPADPPDGTIVERPFPDTQASPAQTLPTARQRRRARTARRATQRMARVMRPTVPS